MLEAIAGRRHVTLTALRRIGKTALIRHLYHLLARQDGYLLVYADLMPTGNFNDFLSQFATALLRSYPEDSSPGKRIWSWIKKIRPAITFDPYTGMPGVSFEISRTEDQQMTVKEAFALMEKSGKKVVIALDEFQQITQYPEKQTESWLRTEMQLLKNTTFILSGSQQQLLSEMFLSAKRPFYASTQLFSLQAIEQVPYRKFIQEQMSSHGRQIASGEIDYMLSWCRRHTFYVQTLCNRVYGSGARHITREVISREIKKLFYENESLFYTFRELLTPPQWQLLTSIAREEVVFNPMSTAFISAYKLGAVGTVKRSLDSLLAKEMIYKEYDKDGKGYYCVYDLFLSRWLANKFHGKISLK